MMKCISDRRIQAVILLLFFNVFTAIFVIYSVVIRHDINTDTPVSVEDLKTRIDKLYEQEYPETQVKEVEHDTTQRSSLEFLSLLKPVVHLSGIDGKDHLNATNRPHTIRNWVAMTGSPRCLIYNGPSYEDGGITIPVNGLYLVYSHVKFYIKENKKDKPIEKFHHKVVKSNVKSLADQQVLANQLTECREGVHEDSHLEYPSDVRGVLDLEAGDQLKVTVSHPQLLTDSTDWNYFGVYMI